MEPTQSCTRIDLSTVLQPSTVDPDSAMGRLLKARGESLVTERYTVLGTRWMAERILERLPAGPLRLDCSYVRVMTTPFIHELRTARNDLTFEAMSQDAERAWRLVDERLRDG